jgi:hypothetical protein
VGFPAVQLDDEPSVPPEEVDEEAVDADVHLRAGNAVAAAKGEEPGLELAAHLVGRDSVPGWKPEVLGLAERCGELLARSDAAEIRKGSRRARFASTAAIHLPSLQRFGVAHGVHPAMNALEATGGDPALDRARIHAHGKQLRR